MMKRNSSEDYLEKILLLKERYGYARSTDLAKELMVSKPTVCGTMKRFRDRELIFFDDKGFICLTDKGQEIAEKKHRKNTMLTKALKGIGVNEENAEKEACGIGNVISDETYERLNMFFQDCIRY